MGKFAPPQLEELEIPSNPLLRVREELEQLGIKWIFHRLGVADREGELQLPLPPLSREIVEEGVAQLSAGGVVAIEGVEVGGKGFVAVGWLEGEQLRGGWTPIDREGVELLQPLLNRPLVAHNLKGVFKLLGGQLQTREPLLPNPRGDSEILGWLLDPDGAHSLESLGSRYLQLRIPKVTKNLSPSQLPAVLGGRLYGVLRLVESLPRKLWPEVLPDLREVELPLIPLLLKMESRGIKVDRPGLEGLKREVEGQLAQLEEQVHRLAGERFNLNSTKQLQYILFEKLGLPPKKRTKTGFSTDETVLTGLKEAHPIVPLLLQYRKLVKLLNTYIDPLLSYSQRDPDHRIYTTFLQTGTATGRLSSRNPNLQNIPIDDRWNIRDYFYTDQLFLSLDYSQIELRLLAHYSEDPHLIDGFHRGEDIHLETARKLFPEDPVKYRGVAKSINFGLIYGMGPRKLAETIGVSQREAKEFIERYFASFPKVREFIKKAQQELQARGFVETLFHRRRFFQFSRATGAVLATYLREGVNTIFQGSAADLIKKAMVEIEARYPNNRLLLQIHDELLFEVESLEEGLKYKEIMESVANLKVPLAVEVKVGKRWGSLKPWSPEGG